MAVGEEHPQHSLVGFDNFVRHNPLSDKFTVHKFHHIEFYAADAVTTAKWMQFALGMTLIAKADASTGAPACTSFVLRSNDLVFVITAPGSLANIAPEKQGNFPHFNAEGAYEFLKRHGLAVRAIGLSVEDAGDAYTNSTGGGARGVLGPQRLADDAGACVISEVEAYGDVVLRFVSGSYSGGFLPGYRAVDGPQRTFGLQRADHCVGNVSKLADAFKYLTAATGFHEFAEFTAEDVGTVDSGLNSIVLANNNEMVLMPINEPTHGTRRKSQIQTYLEMNEGAGVQHIALKTNDIFSTLSQMQAQSPYGGLEFMPRPSAAYYKSLPERVGDTLTPEQLQRAEELGILIDKDDQGILLQIFTKPIGDRPTFFFEIIQRIGCEHEESRVGQNGTPETVTVQAGGCGGFGKGNFRELFKSIEDYLQ